VPKAAFTLGTAGNQQLSHPDSAVLGLKAYSHVSPFRYESGGVKAAPWNTVLDFDIWRWQSIQRRNRENRAYNLLRILLILALKAYS
jgi:hypothetical protein